MIATAERELHRVAETNGQPSGLRIVRVLPTDMLSWAAFPVLLCRIAAFTTRLHLDTPIDAMIQYVRTQWASGSENVAIWMALQNGKIVGHALALMEQSWSIPYAMIVQLELDSPSTLAHPLIKTTLTEIEAWARSQKATCLKMLAAKHPKAWQRMFGFQLDKFLMRKDLS